MISDSTYHDIWDGLLEVSRIRRYYILCESKYRRLAAVFRIVLATSGVGVLASLVDIFEFLPANTIAIFGMLISILIILDLIISPSKTAAQLTIVNSMLNELEDQYRELWEKTKGYQVTDSQALDKKSQVMSEISIMSYVI